MSLARARAARTLQSSLRPRSVQSSRSSLPRLAQAGQRRWQSGDHGASHQSSSDIPWLIGAIAVTVPGTWYLWPSAHSADAGHHDAHHDEHAEAEEGGKDDGEAQEDEASEEKPKEGSKEESKDDGDSEKEEKKKDDGDSEEKAEKKDDKKDGKAEEKDDDKEEKSDEKDDDDKKEEKAPEGDDSKKTAYANNPDGKDKPNFKGKMKEDAEGQSHSRKTEQTSSSRGTTKTRIDSGYQKDLGHEDKFGDAATAKDPKSDLGDISSKQKGLGNTSTRHSTQLEDDPEKSKKGEGTPETAKSMGTVDPSRPAR